jgi:hypothetical protein
MIGLMLTVVVMAVSCMVAYMLTLLLTYILSKDSNQKSKQ